jgi:hypothetical protein
MTSEVCIMNRRGAVLAADSAITASHWNGSEWKEHYFKGANKIFQVSNHHPVGMMIFDSADILRVPWEIVVKDFRSYLGNKRYNSLEEYATEFFTFLAGTARFFPDAIQKEVFLEAAKSAALTLLYSNRGDASAPEDERRAAIEAAIEQRDGKLNELEFAGGIDADLLSSLTVNWANEVAEGVEERREALEWIGPAEPKKLAELGIKEVCKEPRKWMSTTGLVFVGFGDHDIFPQMLEYISCGIIGAKHIAFNTDKTVITHDNPASIDAFAQTSMSDTFSLGFSRDVFYSFGQSVREGLNSFASMIVQSSGGDLSRIADLRGTVEAGWADIRDKVLSTAKNEHGAPLRRVLGSLSVEEMAELAETLINLQSLKEKVTKPSASVGGPVDVAVITKAEGLIWVKRKHFFDPELNPRYLQRLGATYS